MHVYIDFDGVVVDILTKLDFYFGKIKDIEKSSLIDYTVFEEEDFYEVGMINDGFREFLQSLKNLNIPHSILSKGTDTNRIIKEKFIKDNKLDIDIKVIGLDENKFDYMDIKNDILIDDMTSNLNTTYNFILFDSFNLFNRNFNNDIKYIPIRSSNFMDVLKRIIMFRK